MNERVLRVLNRMFDGPPFVIAALQRVGAEQIYEIQVHTVRKSIADNLRGAQTLDGLGLAAALTSLQEHRQEYIDYITKRLGEQHAVT